MAILSSSYAGLNLSSPIIASSSGLTDSVHNIVELEKSGVGAVVLKSIFEEEILMEMEQVQMQMVGKPFIFPETMDYLDEEPHEDLIRAYLRLIQECKQVVKIPIIASINCVSNQKWTYLAEEIQKAGADALELNLFSLPSNSEIPAGEIEEMYLSLVEKVVGLVSIPVTVKISHYFTAFGQMLERFSKTGIKGIVLFNRYYSPDIDIHTQQIVGAFILSNPSDISLPLRWIALSSDSLKVDLAASSGVHSGDDVVKLLLAGASAVQVASVIYKKGPSVVTEMNEFVLEWMKTHQYKFISDFKGKLNFQSLNNPAAWERTQFMREFRQFLK